MTRYRNRGSRPSFAPRLELGMEYDGAHLHGAVLRESGEARYKYNQELNRAMSDRSGTRQILANFTCSNCSHSWHTGQLCTQLLFTSNDRYRTILHAQQCQKCEAYARPLVDEDNYARKIVSALDLWSSRRVRQESTSDFKPTGPHDEERCHGCQIGICSRGT